MSLMKRNKPETFHYQNVVKPRCRNGIKVVLRMVRKRFKPFYGMIFDETATFLKKLILIKEFCTLKYRQYEKFHIHYYSIPKYYV